VSSKFLAAALAGLIVAPLAAAAQAPAGPPPAAPAGPPAPPPRRPPPPPLRTEAGQAIETRAPELASDKPDFPGQTRAPFKATVPFKVTTLAEGLNSPWSLAFLPDGRFLVTEKPGALRVIDKTGKISGPVTGLPPIHAQGQVGLLDVALDPGFARNKRIYFTFSEAVSDTVSHIAVARAVFDASRLALSDVKVIFQAKPDLPNTASANQGSRIAIARDGNLFVTIGDRSSSSPPWDYAQRMDAHLGKIVRITPDGAPAKGNPFIGKAGVLPEIWSAGHRSEQGLAFDNQGRLWETEHGARGGDELNLIQPGRNYGWPTITHGIDYPGAEINGGKTAQAGMEQPRYYWDPVIAPSGLAFYRGAMFPAWKDSVFVGALGRQMLDRLTVKGDKVVDEEPLLIDLKNRVRDVRVSAEGAVYVLTDSGKLIVLTAK
jgi:glucose/arabinose dehydrogenase